jgi:hypothetical protein
MARVNCDVDDCQFCSDENCCTNPDRLELADEEDFCTDCTDCDCYLPL